MCIYIHTYVYIYIFIIIIVIIVIIIIYTYTIIYIYAYKSSYHLDGLFLWTDFKQSDWNGEGRGCSPAFSVTVSLAFHGYVFQSLWSKFHQTWQNKRTTSKTIFTCILRFSYALHASTNRSHPPPGPPLPSTRSHLRGCGMSMRIKVMHVVTPQTAVKIPHATRITRAGREGWTGRC